MIRARIARALRLRCPHCGGGPVFVTWFRMVPACPSCGLTFERGEQGYWLGAYFVGLVAIDVVFSVWWLLVITLSWPAIPWRFLQLSTIGLLLATPVAFYPYSHTLFLALDLTWHPAEDDDFAAPLEHAAARRRRRP